MDTLTAEQAARLLHLNVKRIQSLARAGKLPARRVGRRWLFPRTAIERLLAGPDVTGGAGGVELSARNQLRGRITSMVVEGVMAEVRLAIGEQELVAIITRSSVERLRLRVGDDVFAVIKSTEVMIGKERA